MKNDKKTGQASRWRIPVVLKLLVLVCVAFVALLALLPQPPELETGGKTMVMRRIPDLRDTVDPLAAVKMPETRIPPAPIVPPAPIALPEPEPVKKPQIVIPPATVVKPVQKPKSVTPPKVNLARLPPEPAPGGRVDLPSKSQIRDWLKSQAWEFLGGVDKAGNILYRFEVWLEAPSNVLNAIKSVSYDYDAPSATPPSRKSDLSRRGFRARFGGMSCAQKVTVTLTMNDGRSRRTVVDGCRALN